MKQQAWDIYRPTRGGGLHLITTVFYDPDCDVSYVRRGLIDHDGYAPDIIVVKAPRTRNRE